MKLDKAWTSAQLKNVFRPGQALVPSAPLYGYWQTALSLSPLALYRFNEPSGTTAVDSTSNGHNGAYTTYGGGSFTLGSAGYVDSSTAVALVGSGAAGAYIDIGDLSIYANFTFTGWFKWNGTGGNGGWCGLVGKGGYNGAGFASIFNTGTFENRLYIGGTQRISRTFAYTSGTWYHYGITYDGTNAVMYINGVGQSGASTAPGASGTNVHIGQETTGIYGLFGSMQDWGVWTTALTPAQMLLLATTT